MKTRMVFECDFGDILELNNKKKQELKTKSEVFLKFKDATIESKVEEYANFC